MGVPWSSQVASGRERSTYTGAEGLLLFTDPESNSALDTIGWHLEGLLAGCSPGCLTTPTVVTVVMGKYCRGCLIGLWVANGPHFLICSLRYKHVSQESANARLGGVVM